MNDDQLLRYSRQIMLPGIDIEGQEKLLQSRVLLVGLGGLGSPIAMYLAASGIGTLVLVDFDIVDLSNLQRQIVHNSERIGVNKARSAGETLRALNPEIEIITLQKRLSDVELSQEVQKADVVVDATDNFAIRYALNDSCAKNMTPLVSGAAIRMEGQVSVFDFRDSHSPCYRCLYPDRGELGERCSQTGVLGSVVGMIGSLQATETVKVLLGLGEGLVGRLLLLDATRMEWHSVKLKQSVNCELCRQRRDK